MSTRATKSSFARKTGLAAGLSTPTGPRPSSAYPHKPPSPMEASVAAYGLRCSSLDCAARVRTSPVPLRAATLAPIGRSIERWGLRRGRSFPFSGRAGRVSPQRTARAVPRSLSAFDARALPVASGARYARDGSIDRWGFVWVGFPQREPIEPRSAVEAPGATPSAPRQPGHALTRYWPYRAARRTDEETQKLGFLNSLDPQEMMSPPDLAALRVSAASD
jgi:hypothetical protein